MSQYRWQWASFSELSNDDLYALLEARQAVFVVEQKCAYLDADGYDQKSMHLLLWDESDALAGYLRVLPPGLKYPQAAIGRVLTTASFRGKGLGHKLMKEALARIELTYGKMTDVTLSAQAHLQKFYETQGFVAHGPIYDEDGIAHVAMTRSSSADRPSGQ